MGVKVYCVRIAAFVLSAILLLFLQSKVCRTVSLHAFAAAREPRQITARTPARMPAQQLLSVPMFFEPASAGTGRKPMFVGRGSGMAVELTRQGIEIAASAGQTARDEVVSLRFESGLEATAGLVWRGEGRLEGESNYLIGNDPRRWRTHVTHFARAVASSGGMELAVYGNDSGLEYDLRLQPGADVARLRVAMSGAAGVRVDRNGDLAMRAGAAQFRMKKPVVYEQPVRHAQKARRPKELAAEYVVERDGTIGLRVAPHDPSAALVIDPSISIAYSSFLGGTGSDAANSVAVDSTGKIYIGGTTTSPATFPEATTAQLGPGIASGSGSAAEFFVAEIDPTKSGANSLVYLTFLGGSGNQSGGLIAANGSGNVAITGTTTSADFPVTDGSGRTTGSNDTAVAEIDPTGSKLLYSTLFGGNGAQSTQGAGGIAFGATGNVLVASDTNSTNLPVTSGAYAGTYQSLVSDGFLAVFATSPTPSLTYCTYFGLDGTVEVGGVAVDASSHAYIAGSFTPESTAVFPATNAFQTAYGGASDAFVMKISPAGGGTGDLVYATLLGGSGADQAFAITVDSATPPNTYVTGTTSSANFPTNGAVTAYQTSLPSNATPRTSDAFLSVIAQNATSGATLLAYSTYLGGSQTDAGTGLAVVAPYAVYIVGAAKSWDFPWRDNLQPFNGYGDAFVAKLDTTSAGAASLVYSTPLGGTSPPGVKANAQGTAIALGASGDVWAVGQTTSADFPSAGGAGNGFQPICGSCQQTPPAADAFIVEIQESPSQQLPSLYFSAPGIPLNFGNQSLGSTNVAPQFAAIKNGGEAPLNISAMEIGGANGADFSLSGASGCAPATINPGAMCSFEVTFIPGVIGPEGAFVQVTSNAPGSPQVLEVVGNSVGLAALPANLDFGSQIAGTSSDAKAATLTNTSSQPLQIDSIQGGGANLSMFRFPTESGACVASGMSAGTSCQVWAEFAPASAGTFEAEVDVKYHVQGLSEQELVIPLSGVGLPPAPVASIQPAALSFGTVSVGATGPVQVVTLTNTGSAALNLTSIHITGTNASDFATVTSGSSPCPVSSGSLAIGVSCTAGVQFAPQTSGAKSAALVFTDNAAGSPQSVPLTGMAQSPAIQIAPTSLTFASQSVGTKSAAQQITITNSGTSTLAMNGISVAGANVGDFIEANNCPPSLGAGADCVATVAFQPTAPGTRSAAVRIADDAPGNPQSVSLTGTATQAGASLSPASVNFGNQAAGTPSAAVSVTLTNSGTGALLVTKLSFTGANAGDFTETDNCTAGAAPNGVPAGGTCTVQVTFTPSCGNTAAARSAALALTDNAPGSPQTVALSGTATGSTCFAVAAGGSTSATISAGQTATYSLQLTAANGFSGNVTLACAGAPQAANCMVNPSTANVGGSTVAPFSVNVTTTARTTVVGGPPEGAPLVAMPFAARFEALAAQLQTTPLAPLVLLMIFFGLLAAVRVRRGVGVSRVASSAALFCLLALSLSACGGGNYTGGGGGGDPGTPAGTYKITVTATASGASSGSITLTLTVQ